ncbi:MAG: class I SAM-dependent methyltransferase [Bacillota bacterium]
MMSTQKKIWDDIWAKGIEITWDDLSEEIFNCLVNETQGFKEKTIIEAGSGTGRISLRMASEGASVILVDYSEKALINAKDLFSKINEKGQFVLADIMKMPFDDETADITWNAGVLEHFNFSEQVKSLEEMKRVTRKDGLVISLNPNARCLPYRIGKYIAEETGKWPYGIENPLSSLIPAAEKAGLKVLREYSIGFINGLDFLVFVPGGQYLQYEMKSFYQRLSTEEQKLFPGYLIVSVLKRF